MTLRSRSLLAFAAIASFVIAGCSRDNGTLGPAPFPNTPDIYTDNFGATVNFAAFGGSKVDALSIDNAVKRSGSSSLKITVPALGDPAGSYAGGAFVAAVPRDLSEYNVLSFWARASIPAVLNVAGIANDNTGNSLYTAERNNIAMTTAWQKYTIAIPLPDKLSEEQGLFYFAEGPENGVGYDFWIDDVRFENLNTVVNVRPAITGGALLADIGGTSPITGTSVTVSVDGADQTVKAYPSYFTFTSSAPTVATVSSAGVISVLAGGTANITAKLGSVTATGSIALTAVAPPTVAAATPTRPAGDVISLFSNAYTNVPVTTWSADWDQADVADVTIAGNATKKYSNLVFAGIEFPQINATAMTYLHADVYVGDASSFKIKLVDFGANGAFGGGDDREHELTLNTTTTPALTGGAWSSLDIPLSAFTGLTTRANLSQMILLGASRTAYLDNIYFYKLPAPTAPPAAAPTPTVNAANVISMFSNAYTNVPVDTWRTDWSQGTVSDTTIAGNATKKYSNLTFVGIETVANQINATAMTHFHMDIWTPDAVTGGAAFKVKLVDFGANGVFQNGDDREHELTFTSASSPALSTGNWVSLDIPLSQFTGLTTRANIAQMILVGDDPINTVFVDNVYFYTTGGGSGNVVVSFDETTAPTLSPFEGVTAASVVADPSNASNKVAMITNGVQGAANPWAGVTVSTGGQFSIPQMNVTASLTRMTARVYSPAVGLRIRAKAENAINPAQNHETNATTLTTVANAWETLTFNFAVASPLFDGLPTNPFSATDTYNKLSFFLDYGTKTNTAPRVFYLDDIRFEGTVGSALPLPAPVVAPTTLPANPSLAAANVISLHNSSGTYTNIAVGNWSPDWGQGGTISDFVVNSRTIKFLNLVNYQGINISPDGLAPGALDITGKNTLHISYWTADGESLRISPINASAEYAITVSSITKNGWTELEIPINQAGFSLTSIRQLKFETTTGLGRFYLDNIYFH